jgi:hypothetical protein
LEVDPCRVLLLSTFTLFVKPAKATAYQSIAKGVVNNYDQSASTVHNYSRILVLIANVAEPIGYIAAEPAYHAGEYRDINLTQQGQSQPLVEIGAVDRTPHYLFFPRLCISSLYGLTGIGYGLKNSGHSVPVLNAS